jgi:hypothetical protein
LGKSYCPNLSKYRIHALTLIFLSCLLTALLSGRFPTFELAFHFLSTPSNSAKEF